MTWYALTRHHLRVLASSADLVAATLVLSAGLLVTTGLVLHELPDATLAAAGMLWPTLVFTTLHATTRGLAQDADGGGLASTLLLPVPRSTLVLARAAANIVATTVLAGLVLGAIAVVVPPGVDVASPVTGAAVLLATAGMAVVATLAAYAGVATRARDLVAPTLALPLLLPVLIAGVHATVTGLAGGAWGDAASDLTFLLGYDVLLVGMTILLADAVVDPA